MQHSILTFGDSNTYGALPITELGSNTRLAPHKRWPGVMQSALNVHLIEEGLPGRTCASADEEKGIVMEGRLGLPIALYSHGPIDFLTIMLGSNDVKTCFELTADDIAKQMDDLVAFAQDPDIQARHNGFKTLLISPPPVIETGALASKFIGGAAKAQGLARRYAAIAAEKRIDFFDAGSVISCSRIDGVHFGAPAHKTLGLAVAEKLAGMADFPDNTL